MPLVPLTTIEPKTFSDLCRGVKETAARVAAFNGAKSNAASPDEPGGKGAAPARPRLLTPRRGTPGLYRVCLNSTHVVLRCPAMEAARVLSMSVAEYLEFEEKSDVRHEYIGGEIHAMRGVSKAHNTIAGNVFAALRTRLRGSPCQVFIADFKVRLEVAHEDIFYYPDVVVSCNTASIEQYFLRLPTLVVEVLSPSAETIDRREKKMNYLQSQSLGEYVLVAQDRREVTIFRRDTGWQGETFTAPEAQIELRSIKQNLTLAEIYEDVF